MIDREKFFAEKEIEYNQMVMAEQYQSELQQHFDIIRERGFRIIVLGKTVKVTPPKS